MKAFTTLGDGVAALKLGERPTPAPGRDEVLVKMTAAALNFRDLLVINGTGSWKPHAPRIPVSDGVGVVVAVGEDVSRFRTSTATSNGNGDEYAHLPNRPRIGAGRRSPTLR